MIHTKKAKKGFTIVELVIVIAVIAILAAVLIPTFTVVVTNAKKNAALSEARTAYTEYLSETLSDPDTDTEEVDQNFVIESGDYYFTVNGGQFNTEASETAPDNMGNAVWSTEKGEDDTYTGVVIYKVTTP